MSLNMAGGPAPGGNINNLNVVSMATGGQQNLNPTGQGGGVPV